MTISLFATANRYWHTLRYLRPVQIYGRLWFRVVRSRVAIRPAPLLRRRSGHWVQPARRTASILWNGEMKFLNEARDIAVHGWDDPRLPLLWRYNQHYFDDLNAWNAEHRRERHSALLERWVRENPPAKGTAWAPYPLSLRVVNWIKWHLAGVPLSSACVESLATQARWLCKRLEYHLLGNHLFANAKALVFAGLFFEGAEADAWLEKGLAILADEMPEQIMLDGGHFERSPMYHALALEDVLDLLNLTRAFPESSPHPSQSLVAALPGVARSMRCWLAAMCHPDGQIGFFNDAATEIAPAPSELGRYADELGIVVPSSDGRAGGVRSVWLAESGYIRGETASAVALVDVAPVGPDYIPGHAHADTLSFELSLLGKRIIVNTGTSEYGSGPIRARERGTSAHSTVTIDGMDSSEVWGGFRVARRATPIDLEVDSRSDELVVSCAHDGYRRLPGRPVHRRTWRLSERCLLVEDWIDGSFDSAVARFHLHPDVAISLDDTAVAGTLSLDRCVVARWRVTGGTPAIEDSHYSPEFGRRIPSRCLTLRMGRSGPSRLELTW